MSEDLSIRDVLTELGAKIEDLRGQVESHARQETFHREQRERLAAELDELTRRFEAFQTSAGAVLEVAGKSGARRARNVEEEKLGPRPTLSRLLAMILDDKEGDETFTARQLAREVDQRFSHRRKGRADPRSVATQLRRWQQLGTVHLVQEGRSYHEAVYSRGKK
jgi:hypothetical protein